MSTPTTIYQLDKPAVGGDADIWGGLLNIDLDDLDTFLAKPRWKKNAPAVSGTTTLDLSLANFFEFTVSQATTLSITNVPATLPDGTVPAQTILLKITNGAAFALTWPGSIVWPQGGVVPGLAVAGVDLIMLATFNAGTTWYAFLVHMKTLPAPGELGGGGSVTNFWESPGAGPNIIQGSGTFLVFVRSNGKRLVVPAWVEA